MKKVLLVFTIVVIASFFLLGCKKEIEATYQIYNNCSSVSSAYEPLLNGTLYEIVVFEYFGSDVVREKNIDRIAVGGKSGVITAHEKAEKIKVSFKFLPKESSYYNMSSNNRKYTVQYYYLKREKKDNKIIAELNGNTMLSGSINPTGKSQGVTIKQAINELIEK